MRWTRDPVNEAIPMLMALPNATLMNSTAPARMSVGTGLSWAMRVAAEGRYDQHENEGTYARSAHHEFDPLAFTLHVRCRPASIIVLRETLA